MGLLSQELERFENEHFRTDPRKAVKRAILRQESMKPRANESIEKDHSEKNK
jgi:hypothetical protein